MKKISPHTIEAAWTPEELRKNRSWVLELDKKQQQELLDALDYFKSHTLTSNIQEQITKGTFLPDEKDFPLPNLGVRLKEIQNDLEHSLGISLIRSFPIQDSSDDNRTLFGGLLSYIGTAQAQTVRKELIQSVQDEGQAHLDERRGSKHNLGLPIHNDGCDVVGFLCTETPLSGGQTILVSAAAIHNAMLENHPDALACLYEPYESAWQDYMYPEGKNTEKTVLPRTWSAPIFSEKDGQMCCRYSRFYIDRAQNFPGVEKLSSEKLEALDIFDSYLADVENWQYRRDFEKGDVIFLNNHVSFHSRTAYEDGEGVDEKRHLYRVWMAAPNSRPLADSMACFFGGVGAGEARGGVKKEFIVV